MSTKSAIEETKGISVLILSIKSSKVSLEFNEGNQPQASKNYNRVFPVQMAGRSLCPDGDII